MGLFGKNKKDAQNNNQKQVSSNPINEEYFCPECGTPMIYVGGLLEWECPSCGAEGSTEYDRVNNENYVSVAKSFTYEEIYSNPIGNEPDCCKACGGPYPSCMTSCKMFDD